MKNTLIVILSLFSLTSFAQKLTQANFIIGKGQMPNVAVDVSNRVHVVYGSGDSILYTQSADNAITFSEPELVTVLPGVYTFATRGPQIAATKTGILVIVATSAGNIHSFNKPHRTNRWVSGKRVNDVNEIAKEGLTGLSADGNNAVAVWLDLRGNKRNKIYSARSADGGNTWSKNKMVYASPDTTVCECCKPSVLVKGSKVYVMFRNWLKGNRDMYLARSNDGGNTFREAQKLGIGNWKLNGCPMDGGGLAMSKDDEVLTVWQRQGKIFAADLGKPEIQIGEGRGCVIETVNNQEVYAWTEKGQVIMTLPKGQKQILGKGSQPVLKALMNGRILCVWESEKEVHGSVFQL